MPKGFRKQLKLVPQIVGVERRQELLDNIADNNTFLPQGVHIKDMDSSFIDFVTKDLRIEIDGEEVPVIFLTIQRYADFTKTWKFTDEYKNIKMPFVTIVRNPDIQKGTNQAALANIPGHRHYTYYKVPSNDGSRTGIDVYKIPQPTAVDITYEVRFFSNKMSDINVMHKRVHTEFNATQAYIYPKGHPMPVTLPTVTDESSIEDFESRRFYVQAYEMLLAGYILDEEDFEVSPTINRAMVLSEISVDPATAQPKKNPNPITPVIRTQGNVVIKNTVGQLINSSSCGTTYIVGNTNILNSGSTFSVTVPATSGYTLPNITHYDCDGSPVTLPAQTSFSATPFCASGTIVNSNATYSGTVSAGDTLILPEISISGNSQFLYNQPSVTDVNIIITNGFNFIGSASGTSWYVSASTVSNSGNTFNQSIPATSGYTLPNIVNYDSDGSPVETPAMVGFTATTCQNVTIINSGATYTATTAAGSTFELPNEVIEFIDVSGNTITSWYHPPLSDQTVTVSGICESVQVVNSGATYSVTVESGDSLLLPNITHTDSDGSPVTLPAQTAFVATPCGGGTPTITNALSLDGVNDYGVSGLPKINLANFSVSFVFKMNSTAGRTALYTFAALNPSGGRPAQGMYYEGNAFYFLSEDQYSFGQTLPWVGDTNYHVFTMRYDTVINAVEIFIDGVSLGVCASPVNYTKPFWSFLLGRAYVLSNYGNVRLTDVRVFNHYLTTGEIATLQTLGNPVGNEVLWYPFTEAVGTTSLCTDIVTGYELALYNVTAPFGVVAYP